MKAIKFLFSLCLIALTLHTCADDEKNVDLNSATAPTNLDIQFQVTQDNTGLVTMTPIGEGAVSFDIAFGDDTLDSVSVENGDNVTHTYSEGTYIVSMTAYGVTGLTAEITKEIILSFQAPTNLEVTIENDAAISKQVNVTVNADFAINYEVYSGESGVVDPVVSNIEDTAILQYSDSGFYDITIVVLGAAIETLTYVEENFEVTEILAPTQSAPTPQARQPEDVVSVFSDAYSNVTLDELPTSWSSSEFLATTIESNNVWQLSNLDFIGMVTNYAEGINLSQMETMHIDYWVPDGVSNELLVKIVNTIDGGEDIESLGATISGSWQSIDIEMTGFDGGDLSNKEKITQILIDSDGVASTVYIDNFYFYKEPTQGFDDGLLTNGDFELGSDSWLVGVDPNSAAPVTTDTTGNTYYSVNVTNPNPSEPYLVNTSQFVELISGETYTLTFDAWSDVNRTIIAGIGLSANPWTNVIETVDITTTRTTYSYTFESIGFGDPQARVLFDLNAVAGVVNLDNVGLYLGDGPTQGFDDGLLTNGDFELGSDSWLVGVDPNSAAPVTTDTTGNTYYSVNVTNPNPSEPYLVNTSQFVELISGETYTLTFDAWSDVNRTIIAGIGLSANPWTNVIETVDITTTRTTYSYTFESIGFGDPQARVLFDLNAVAGVVNLDNVSLIIE